MRRLALCLLLVAPALTASGLVQQVNTQGQVLFYRNLRPGTHLGKPIGKMNSARFYEWDATILEASQYYAIDPLLVKALLLVESGLSPKAVSKTGARGVAQFMPKTASRMGVVDPHDPWYAIWGCAALLRRLSDQFGADWRLVLAGYNAGEGAVLKAGHNVPKFKETQAYVPNVLWAWDRLQSTTD